MTSKIIRLFSTSLAVLVLLTGAFVIGLPDEIVNSAASEVTAANTIRKPSKEEKKRARKLLKKVEGVYGDEIGWSSLQICKANGYYGFLYIRPGNGADERNLVSCKGNTLTYCIGNDGTTDGDWYKLVIGKKKIVLYRKLSDEEKFTKYCTALKSKKAKY